jgi:phospholipid-translocating ATPase
MYHRLRSPRDRQLTSTRFIETHSKTTTNLVALVVSIGGWFLWNVILAAAYPIGAPIYYVRNAFFTSFGRSFTWWLTLILIIFSVHVFEFAVSSLRATFFTTDEDLFQALEKDPEVKRRFEEAASEELQMGWDRATNEEKRKEDAVKKVVDQLKLNEEDRREEQVREMLRNRDKGPGEAGAEGRGTIGEEMEGEEINRILSRGYGHVREE